MDHDSSKAEERHGAHYWCPGSWNSNVSVVVVRGGIAVALSPSLGSLVTKTSVPGRANSNGTEQITTTRKKNTKPKCTSKKKASVKKEKRKQQIPEGATNLKPPLRRAMQLLRRFSLWMLVMLSYCLNMTTTHCKMMYLLCYVMNIGGRGNTNTE